MDVRPRHCKPFGDNSLIFVIPSRITSSLSIISSLNPPLMILRRCKLYALSFMQSLSSNPHPHLQATVALNTEFYILPACVPALSQIISDSPDQPVSSVTRIDGRLVESQLWITKIRQLAAVELRKRILQKSGTLWVNLPQDQRDHIKSNLPSLIVREQKYVL